MTKKLIAVQLYGPQLDKIDKIVEMTGWNQSEVIRQLIDAAMIRPPAVNVELDKDSPSLVPVRK